MPMSRQEHNDRDSLRHLGDFTMEGCSDPAQYRQRLFRRAVPREFGGPALPLVAELLSELCVGEQSFERTRDCIDVVSLHGDRGFKRELRQRARVTDHRRYAARHGFQQWQPKALVEAREGEATSPPLHTADRRPTTT